MQCFLRFLGKFKIILHMYTKGFPGGFGGKEPVCQCRKHK